MPSGTELRIIAVVEVQCCGCTHQRIAQRVHSAQRRTNPSNVRRCGPVNKSRR